jgi:hypothetical protein
MQRIEREEAMTWLFNGPDGPEETALAPVCHTCGTTDRRQHLFVVDVEDRRHPDDPPLPMVQCQVCLRRAERQGCSQVVWHQWGEEDTP